MASSGTSTTTTSSRTGDGTSTSVELTGFQLAASGPTPVVNVSTVFTDYLGTGPGDSRYYLVGNPFARPLPVSGLAATGGLQGNAVQVYDPEPPAGYRTLSAVSDVLAVWQGAIAEVAAAGDQTVTYTFPPTVLPSPTFYGKTAAGEVAFRLDGTLDGGAVVGDRAARLAFDDAAAPGWDVLDLRKLTPPGSQHALVAPVLARGGAPYRAAVSALPVAPATVPLAFAATGAGSFTLTWTADLPAGYTGTLRDVVTGSTVDLSAGSYAFTSDATAWTDRFEVVLSSGVVAGEGTPVSGLTVGAVRPNPTAGQARVRVEAPAGEAVTVRVIDALGRTVGEAFAGPVAAGGQEVMLATEALAPGVYVVRVESATAVETRRLTVLR